MMGRYCKYCKREYGHDQDCPDAAWWETREHLEAKARGETTEGTVTLPAGVVREMLDGIYGEGNY